MRRRDFVQGVAVSAAWPLAASAQQRDRVRRVGIVMPYAKGDTESEAWIQAFKQELAHLGWVDGRNVQFDERWTTDNMDTVRSQAAGLMASNPDVVVATGGRVIPALMHLSRSIPIVAPGVGDPVGVGEAQTLAHPGGNVTGFVSFELPVLTKSLEMLKQLAPATTRVAMIYNPDNPSAAFYRRTSEAASRALAIEPVDAPVHGLADIDRAVTQLADSQSGGIFFFPDVTTSLLRNEIVALVAQRRLPAMYSYSFFVRLGGLAFYGANRMEMFRQSANYVDRILHGEKAGDLPFQQPTKYELLINLKTAKALGLDIPQSLLATADEVIE